MSKTKPEHSQTNKEWKCALSQRQNIFSGARLLDSELSGDWHSCQMEFIPPTVKEREMPPRIDEWQMSHFHLWGWECSHWSAVMSLLDWNVFVSMSLCKRTRSERTKKRAWAWDFFPPSFIILQAMFFYIEQSLPVPIYQTSVTVLSPCLHHGRCFSRNELGSPSSSLLTQMWERKRKCACLTRSWIKTNSVEV